jgi:3-hydroxyacyl-[acyl-carrier-protein] dehydratase
MDAQELQSLVRTGRSRPLWDPLPCHRVSLGRLHVERMLPHRSPFLLVDEVTEVDLTRGLARSRRRIDPQDPTFRGHFPGEPIYPGALQVEMMGQAALCLLHLLDAGSADVPETASPRSVRLLKVHHAAFFAEVRPGDDLHVLSKNLVNDGLTAIMAAQLMRGGTICSLAVEEVYLVDE